MDILTRYLPELSHIQSLPKSKVGKYIKKAKPGLIECLAQIALNIVYASQISNGLPVKPHHAKKLSKYKKPLLSLVKTKATAKRKRLLKGGLVLELLTVLSAVIASLASIL